jgi:phage-related protein
MPSVAPGVSELRLRDRSGIIRVFYYLKSEHGILVFHAFSKKTQTTSKHDISIGVSRLKEMLHDEEQAN